jgi:hypothetical protein
MIGRDRSSPDRFGEATEAIVAQNLSKLQSTTSYCVQGVGAIPDRGSGPNAFVTVQREALTCLER